jgi:hypothetical protein
MATRPATSPGALQVLEEALAMIRADGLDLEQAMDVINAVAIFVIGHALAEVGRTPGDEGTGPESEVEPVDATRYPNLPEALATDSVLDFDRRFLRTLDILIEGYAAAG